MRDYLYIWNDPEKQFIVASGIEFKDIACGMGMNGGLVLVESYAWTRDVVERDGNSCLYYVRRDNLPNLVEDDSWAGGNLCWVDYVGDSFPAVSDQETAEMLFFSHAHRPLGRIGLSSLGNRYLCYAHDDGWYLKSYYSSWEDVAGMIGGLCPGLDLDELHRGTSAYWVTGTSIEMEERTEDIDAIQNRRC